MPNYGRETIEIEIRRRKSHIQHGSEASSALMFHASGKLLWARCDFNGYMGLANGETPTE